MAEPRYAEIHRTLETAILSGEWQPGHRVPSEHALAERYACSRMTVNKALSALAGRGLIVRKRRSGSFVATPSSLESVLEIRDIAADAERHGQDYRFELLRRSERKATRADAQRLRVALRSPVLALACLHHADGKPLVYEDRLINLSAVPAARAADFRQRPPGGWLLAEIPWSDGEHHIRAVNATAEIAGVLAIVGGAACLVMERITWQAGQPLTHVVLSYPGERHQLVARFSPGLAQRRRPALL